MPKNPFEKKPDDAAPPKGDAPSKEKEKKDAAPPKKGKGPSVSAIMGGFDAMMDGGPGKMPEGDAPSDDEPSEDAAASGDEGAVRDILSEHGYSDISDECVRAIVDHFGGAAGSAGGSPFGA